MGMWGDGVWRGYVGECEVGVWVMCNSVWEKVIQYSHSYIMMQNVQGSE